MTNQRALLLYRSVWMNTLFGEVRFFVPGKSQPDGTSECNGRLQKATSASETD